MKRILPAVAVILTCVIISGLSFWAGGYGNAQRHMESREKQCCEYMSSALAIAENRDLSGNGVREMIISYLFAAHELCDDPEQSARLNDLHTTLIYGAGTDTDIQTDLTNILNSLQKKS